MPPGPVHARQRRRRLLALVVTLLVVAAVSPRLQENVESVEGAGADPLARPPARLASAARSLPPAIPERPARAGAGDLFRYQEAPVLAALIEQRAPVPGSEVHYVSLNRDLLVGKDSVFWKPGGRFTVPLPDREVIEVEIETTDVLGPDEFTSEGHIVGVPEGRAIFAYSRGKFSARFENLPQGDFQLRSLTDPKGNPVNQFYAVDPTQIPNCGGQPEIETSNDAEHLLVVDGGKSAPRLPWSAGDEQTKPLDALVSGQAVVDVLVAYTRAAREAVGSEADLRAEIALGIAKVNSDFRNSAITARVRLAGTVELDYAEDGLPGTAAEGYQTTTLDRLRKVGDGHLDAVHAKRDEVGADLVCLLLRRADPKSAGMAYVLKDPRGYFGPLFAFSIVQYNLVGGAGSVLSHELGHSLGCAHARQDPDASGTHDGAYPYSYGHRISGLDTAGQTRQARTIMAYDFGNQNIPRVPYFSNPRLTLPSVTVPNGPTYRFNPEPALGVAEGAGPPPADNARTIEQTAFQVASFRVSRDFSAVGTLVNVSTRAVVGTDERVMIGGFVLAGPDTKRVLVRAIGPALAAFGVPKPLIDPVLEVIDSNRIKHGTNDDWSRPETGAASPAYALGVANASSAAGAFALPATSKDAALVLELPPGAYSAIVTGKGSASGEALIEAYELTPAGGRLVNLSTRAHGSPSQPILAGFVVAGDALRPQQRKRMLIRVLGPTLGKFGLAATSVMGDPLMQVYDAKGQLILENDDWDPPTSRVAGETITTRGIVDQAPERQVFDALMALGAVEMQPVEPAAVLELPAGAYTVRVTPFEDLTGDTPQPAKPGIAIVEVYELADPVLLPPKS